MLGPNAPGRRSPGRGAVTRPCQIRQVRRRPETTRTAATPRTTHMHMRTAAPKTEMATKSHVTPVPPSFASHKGPCCVQVPSQPVATRTRTRHPALDGSLPGEGRPPGFADKSAMLFPAQSTLTSNGQSVLLERRVHQQQRARDGSTVALSAPTSRAHSPCLWIASHAASACLSDRLLRYFTRRTDAQTRKYS